MIRYSKGFIELLRKEYPILGSKGFIERYNLNTTPHRLTSTAYFHKIKMPKEQYRAILGMRSKKKIFTAEYRKKLSISSTKYNYEAYKKKIIELYTQRNSCKEIAALLNLEEYPIKAHLKKWKIMLRVKNNKYILLDTEVTKQILENYLLMSMKDVAKKVGVSYKQMQRFYTLLNIVPDLKFRKEATTKFNTENNPMNSPISRAKSSQTCKRKIREHPETLLNRRLRRNKRTSLEKKTEAIFIKRNIPYLYNKFIKTATSGRFPDFRVGNIIFECDGNRFHFDTVKELLRDRELIEAGYTVYHFTEGQINKNISEVEACILNVLKV